MSRKRSHPSPSSAQAKASETVSLPVPAFLPNGQPEVPSQDHWWWQAVRHGCQSYFASLQHLLSFQGAWQSLWQEQKRRN